MKWLTVNAKADAHEMLISGPIGQSWWDPTGTASKEFRDELNKIPKGTKINVRINSEGGSIKDGLEIYNSLKARSKDVTAYVDGYALSIASVIPLAASRVISPKASVWMVHEPWSQTSGNAEDHLAAAEMLNTHGDMLADVYAEELGKPKAEMRAAMKKETWFTGAEATAFGLADETPEEDSEPAFACLGFQCPDLSRFRNVPKNIFNMLSGPVRPADKNNKTMKNKLIAVLAKHGITASADWTDEQFEQALNGLEAKDPKGKTDPNLDNKAAAEQMKELQAQLRKEKRARIRKEVLTHGENRIPNDKVDLWVERALAAENEADIYTEIGGLAEFSPGSEAARGAGSPPRITEGLSPLEKLKQEHKGSPAALKAAMKRDWDPLLADAYTRGRTMPVGANTYAAGLVTDYLMAGAITDLVNVWAPLGAFSIDFTPDPIKPLANHVLTHLISGAATQTDATNFESGGNSNVGSITVATHQYTQNFQVSNTDLNKGLRMEKLVKINTAAFADKIIAVAMVPITTAIFGAASVTSSAAAFGWSDVSKLQGLLKKAPIKNLVLDGAYIASIANVPNFFQKAGTVGGGSGEWKQFGWDGIYPNSNWTGAGANVVGFANAPQAIVGVIGAPLTPDNIPGSVLAQTTQVLPGLDISIAAFSWFSTISRTMWASLDVVFGVKEGDTTAGFIVTSA